MLSRLKIWAGITTAIIAALFACLMQVWAWNNCGANQAITIALLVPPLSCLIIFASILPLRSLGPMRFILPVLLGGVALASGFFAYRAIGRALIQ